MEMYKSGSGAPCFGVPSSATLKAHHVLVQADLIVVIWSSAMAAFSILDVTSAFASLAAMPFVPALPTQAWKKSAVCT